MFDELEQRLRASPTDFEAALVYADALSAADDPRGQLIVAQCALVKATNNQDFEAASALGEQVAAWVLRYGDRWNGRPGGFPFRDEWRPLRSYLRYGVGVDGPGMGNFTHVGGREAESLYGPVRSFLETMTTSRGPVEVHVNILRGTGHSLDEILDEQRTDVPRNVTELVTDLIALLGDDGAQAFEH